MTMRFNRRSLMRGMMGGAGVVLGILASLAFVALAIWIGVKVSLVPSVLMLERLPLRAAIARSWSLTNNSFWKTFGIIALVTFILSAASQIVAQPVSLLTALVPVILFPNGSDSPGFFVTIGAGYLLLAIITLVTTAITIVMQTSTITLIYIDLRMRKEALDLKLMQFVEARQAGDSSVADPYLVGAAGPVPTTVPTTAPAAASESPWA